MFTFSSVYGNTYIGCKTTKDTFFKLTKIGKLKKKDLLSKVMFNGSFVLLFEQI